MQKFISSFLFLLFSMYFVTAQDKDQSSESAGFKKENLFTGGTLNLLFGTNMTSVGATPCIGYSITEYLDAGLTFGIDYTSMRSYSVDNDRLRQTIFTPGAFLRLFPFQSIFAVANFELNNVKFHYIPAIGSSLIEDRRNLTSQSTLVGGGYASGRSPYQRSFYYISVLWDVGNDPNSPYKDNLRRSAPVIRAGYHIALFQGRNSRR